MNAKYDELNTSDVATMLGVQKCTVAYWCQKGYIKFQDISNPGSNRPRYLFDVEEVNRVAKLKEKYGKSWVNHNDRVEVAPEEPKTTKGYYGITDPEDYIPDVDETINDIKKLRALKVQRDRLLSEVDALTKAIDDLKAKIAETL